MFHNYLITALRNFTRHKLYSFINIAGLTLGLTCAIFIILFVRDQLSYDRWIPDSENLYRVENTLSFPGQSPEPGTHIPFIIPQAMLEHIPEVKARTRLLPQSFTVRVGDRQFSEMIDVVDPNFFNVIRLPLVEGDPRSVFAQPESAVLSQTEVRKYFGTAPPLGKTITVSTDYCDARGNNCHEQELPLTVTGVLRDLPHNTQLVADILIPNTSRADPTPLYAKTKWLAMIGWGYVQLAPGADPNVVTAKLRTIIDHSLDPKSLGASRLRGSEILNPRLTRFRDAHLSTDQYFSMTPPGSWATVNGFMGIGVLILLMASFNFTNLATARAMVRAREISLRKVVGAARSQIAIQFLGESILTALIGLALALALTEMFLPWFGRFLSVPMQFHYTQDWAVLLFIIGIGIAVGLFSGVYPALVLSGIRPSGVLRNNARLSGSGLLRTALVILQFAVSIGLGIAVSVIFGQISFARNMDLGFRKDGILWIQGYDLSPTERQSFIQALRASPNILGIATSDDTARPFVRIDSGIDVHGPGAVSSQTFRLADTDPNFLPVYDMPLLAGRALSDKYGRDVVDDDGKNAAPYDVLVNETAARRLGYTAQDALGRTFIAHTAAATIVGVVADSKIYGTSAPIAPTMYRYQPTFATELSVRVAGTQLAETLAFIDRTWHRFAPNAAIQRQFVDVDFERQFLADERQGDIFGLFVGIAIFIAALGLFGLAAFSTERRTKEIGLRKTFGARTKDIILLLLWQFSIPVLVANVIAWPVAYYYLHNWLEGYAYRIPLSPLYFVGAGAAALVIAWATVIVHAAHVAKANPIHALRYE